MSNIEHVWFDCDGTLYVQSDELKRSIDEVIFRELSKRTGQSIDDIREAYGPLREERGTNTQAMAAFDISPEDARTIYNMVQPYEFVSADPHLGEMLRRLHEGGVQTSVFTNNKRSTLLKILERLEVSPDAFTFLMTAEEAQITPKPSAAGYRELVRRSDTEARHLLFVGDRVRADIAPAREQGMNTLLIKSDFAGATEYDNRNETYHFIRPVIYDTLEVISELNLPNQ